MIEIIGTALYQWDTGRSVLVKDSEADHVHFANKGDSKAVIMDIENSQAKIPDYLFQTGKQLCAYAVKNGVTIESHVFYVTPRERPENYVYEEDRRNYIYDLISSAEKATEDAKNAATTIEDTVKSALADVSSVTVLGFYNSEAELKAEHPSGNVGDAFLVNGDLYVWSAVGKEWVNAGKIKGPQGETGRTAYEYAVNGGYTGTEAQFAQQLAYDAKTAIANLKYNDVGAAPTGYGFGGSAVQVGTVSTDAELDTALESVYSAMANGETKLVKFVGYPSNSDYSWFGLLSKSSVNYGSLLAHSAFDRGTVIVKTRYNGSWEGTEWINPPMIANEEYRTTERSSGKAIYKKLIKIDSVSAGSAVNIEHGIDGISYPIKCEVFSTRDSISNAVANLKFNRTNISFTLPNDVGGYAMYAVLSYCVDR